MFGLGLSELIVIFLVVLLLFGSKSLPEIARGLGQAIRIFKKEMNGLDNHLDQSVPKNPKEPSDSSKTSPSS